ncbi:LysR family transcriptional regulator [Nocardia cyriacigeorgica]|uniref:LysR family transcriptional regulator n=1 Tax=Nocardia cyriacigeorgica TaxID=135487 RepID=UPI0002D7F9CE|nr:LysR family transcriptional regulator [Nocardia cyriacigeorgica]MBF6287859.1 LysR family transcriptional regulator [Nocardia cyriacigeorgica]MBF6324514.1 LysR family transcriptional regulator [Nocardia cyriacigeorgica]MBF6499060.1 LysR family transcriptional regulator [Nocardia cyriacigeorgica]TLF52918.1 LysR family transcriptional regulator [Nocardia cyriacigeorgica]
MNVHGRDLGYFVAVAEELHFGRAAERLFISQPALSKQIRALERQLGAPLFDRDRRTVTLTPVGAALLPHARTILAEWDSARAAVDAAKTTQAATLVIGMSTSPGRGLLPAVRSRMTERFPQISIALRQIAWGDPTAGLADGSTDVAFVWLPLPEQDRFDTVVVAREPRNIALPASHRLAEREAIDFADVIDEPFLALPPGAGPLRDYWLAMDSRAGRPPVIGAEITSAEETHEAVAAGLGLVLLAAGNAPLIARDDVVVRPIHGVAPAELAVARRRDDHRPLVLGYLEATRRAGTGP